MTVVAGARGAESSRELLELRAVHGDRLRIAALDVTDERSIERAAAQLDGEPCALLVHVAAMMHPSGRGENTVRRLEACDMATVFHTNVIGPAMVTKALYPSLQRASKTTGSAKIVAVGAGVGSISTNAAGGWYSYRLSKTALNALIKNLAIEGARSNVLAYSLYPQMVDTAFAQPYLKGNPYPELRTPHETAERLLQLADELGPADSGRFINIWSREDIPY